jgi:hypothetical protein
MTSMPNALQPFFNRQAVLLPGETFEDVLAFREAFARDVEPSNMTAWCLAFNVADLVRETVYYRNLRNAVIVNAQRVVVGECLKFPPARRGDFSPSRSDANCPESFDWLTDPAVRDEINRELEEAGYPLSYILATANDKCADEVGKIERTLASLDNRVLRVQRQLDRLNKNDAAKARKATASCLKGSETEGRTLS